jgi:hypothetical protein
MGATLAVTISNNSSLDLNCYARGDRIQNYSGPSTPLFPAGATIPISWEKDDGFVGGGFTAHGSMVIEFWVRPGFQEKSGPMTRTWPGFQILTVDYDDSPFTEWWQSGVNSYALPAFPVAVPFAIPSISATPVSSSAASITIS